VFGEYLATAPRNRADYVASAVFRWP
jgi:hypothetical protein